MVYRETDSDVYRKSTG